MKRTEILSHGIQYRDMGSGSIIILVHGYGGTIYDWDEVAENLSRNYRVIVPNLSSIYMDPMRAVSFSQQVTVFREFVSLFKKSIKDQIYLVGGSYGAAICYAMAIEEPDLANRIVLINPMPPHPKDLLRNPMMKILLEVAKVPPAIMLMLMSPMGRIGLKYIQKIFDVPWIKSNAQKNRLARITTRKAKLITHVIHRFAWICNVEDWDLWEKRLGYLRTAVHILWGSRDTLFVDNTYIRLSEKFPSCEISKIDGGKHMLMKERPEEVSKTINQFLQVQEKKLKVVYDNPAKS
jgi:pimeloyl-ACP methyl ester carboxylesterase